MTDWRTPDGTRRHPSRDCFVLDNRQAVVPCDEDSDLPPCERCRYDDVATLEGTA